MNDYSFIPQRITGRTLLVVEGYHEKEELFFFLLRCFPEINISTDDILIYKTTIYDLYEKIAEEYDDYWDDVDLPLLLTKETDQSKLAKRDFTNIFLIFDYERQHPTFSESKILKLQACFDDSTDRGKLYVNYPMVESYLDIKTLPIDVSFKNRCFPASFCRGAEYKKQFAGTKLFQLFTLKDSIGRQLSKYYNVLSDELCDACSNELLSIAEERERNLQSVLSKYVPAEKLCQAKKHFNSKLNAQYPDGFSYWEYVRTVFKQLIHNNICKAHYIQHGVFDIEYNDCSNAFNNIDLYRILEAQNVVSRNAATGFIWVLNTSLFLVIEYNSQLMKMNS